MNQKYCVTVRFASFAFLLASANTFAGFADIRETIPVEKEAQSLIGIVYPAALQGEKISPRSSCTSVGGGEIQIGGVSHEKWWFGTVTCQDRKVMTLEQQVGEENGLTTWRIVDTLLLPPVAEYWDPRRQHKLQISMMGYCALDGRTDTSFFALVRWRDRELVDWQTGVEHAWTYDIEKGRIVPVSTKRIVCEWFEP